MRISEWRIVWDPTGESPLVLLDHGDTMAAEISLGGRQLVDVATLDFVTAATVSSRGNVRESLEFSRIVPHASAAASWEACHAALLATPWGKKGLLSIKPRNGPAWYYYAAVTTAPHTPRTDGELPESDHRYSFRVAAQSALLLTGGIVIIGGYFNPITGGYVVPLLPPGVNIPGGSTVIVSGTPGMVSGGYTVVGSGIGSGSGGTLDLESDEPEPVLLLGAPSISGSTRFPGSNVLATPATWAHATEVNRQWWFNGAATGMSSTTFTIPGDAEAGDTIFWQEVASNSLGPAGAQSNMLTVLEPPFLNLSPPFISGGTEPESILSLTPGEWQSEDSVSGEWYLNGSPTGFHGGPWEIPSDAEEGDEIFYRETASRDGEEDLTASSNIITVAQFDASPLVIPTADLWVGTTYLSGERHFVGVRRVSLKVEWKALPIGTKVRIANYRDVPAPGGIEQLITEQTIDNAAGDGSTNAETSIEFQVTCSPPGLESSDDYALFATDLNGRDYTASEETLHREFDSGGSTIRYTRTNPNLEITISDAADNVLAIFSVVPGFTTTNRLRSAAPSETNQSTTRGLRLVHTDEGFELMLPEGFTAD